MPNSKIEFLLNDELISIDNLEINTTVLDYIRNQQNLKGTKEGCASGDCGACTAVVAELIKNKLKYKTINTCITFLYTLHGKKNLNISWPNNAKLALQFVLNYEEGAENNILNGDDHSEIFLSEIIGSQAVKNSRHMNMESIYEYGSRRGFWRVYNEFVKRKIPLTIFGVGMALEKNNEVCSAIKEANLEIASHGYRWIDYQYIDRDIERKHIRKCYEVIKKIFGEYPVGWYTGRTSPNTRQLVLENTDILYDSDSYSDDLPYWENIGQKKHLIIPYTLDNNDMRFATSQGFNTGDHFYNYLKDSFDCLYNEGNLHGSPKMMSVGLHCRIIGRPGRMQSLIKFFDYVQSFDDIWICQRKDIAHHWHNNYQ